MNVEINGEKLTVPFCSCGKCIIRRNRDGNRNSKYPYNRKMGTTYTNAFQKKDKGLSAPYFNRSLRNGFDGKYKQHLTSGLMSTMKFDFKPFMIKLDLDRLPNKEMENTPFYGRSTYGTNFPSWGSPSSGNGPKDKLPLISVPFKGNSNYDDSYKPFDEDYRTSPKCLIPCSMEFRGRILNDPNQRESYQDRKNPFSMEKPKKYDIEKTLIIPAEYPKEFNSTYGGSFGDLNSNCELANYLRKSGMSNLEL